MSCDSRVAVVELATPELVLDGHALVVRQIVPAAHSQLAAVARAHRQCGEGDAELDEPLCPEQDLFRDIEDGREAKRDGHRVLMTYG